MKCHLP